jgi:L-alanine-DL-glutamate epimerase-like enolase superfamily enzyme
VALTQIAAAMLAELVQERRPVRASWMKCVRQGGITSAVRIMERARTSLDVKTGRMAWRAIRTITHVGGDYSTKEFFFDPPAGFRYAVIQAAASVP